LSISKTYIQRDEKCVLFFSSYSSWVKQRKKNGYTHTRFLFFFWQWSHSRDVLFRQKEKIDSRRAHLTRYNFIHTHTHTYKQQLKTICFLVCSDNSRWIFLWYQLDCLVFHSKCFITYMRINGKIRRIEQLEHRKVRICFLVENLFTKSSVVNCKSVGSNELSNEWVKSFANSLDKSNFELSTSEQTQKKEDSIFSFKIVPYRLRWCSESLDSFDWHDWSRWPMFDFDSNLMTYKQEQR